jgi:hypothetical protein
MRGSKFIRYVSVAAAVGAVFTGADAASGITNGTTQPALTDVVRYSFETAAPVAGAHALTTIAARGGTTRLVAHGTGYALEFPAKCTGAKCPKAVLQAASSDVFNPGSAPFRYGATILLARNQTTGGQNVLQKGYSATGGQYKLQIDGSAGKPSCVLVGTGKSRIHAARSGVTVADGQWHTVECQRTGTSLTVLVDGLVRGATTVPAALLIANPAPLSLGGKGAYADNDQFHGAMDDVWLAR